MKERSEKGAVVGGGRGMAGRRRSARRVQAELLERRVLFAAVSWTGAVSNVWTTAGNWSNNAVPTSADDVTIDVTGTPLITIPSGTQTIRSLNTAETLSVNGGSLAVLLTASVSANLTIGGGTISGGTYTLTGGAVFAGSTSGGTLTNVSLTGDVVLAASQSVLLTGTTSFTTARLQGSNADLRMAPGYTLNSVVVAEGSAIGTRFVTMAVGGTGTVTVGTSGVLRLAAGSATDFTLRNSSAATLINNGMISAEAAGQTLSISNTTFQNNPSGTTRVLAGTLNIGATTWENQGTIGVGAGTTLNLGGTFDNSDATGSFGTFANAGGTVNVTGTINNTGSAFALNTSTGSFTLLGGTISGGNILYANGQSLLLSTSGGTLNGVGIGGELVLGTSFTVLLTGATTFTAMRMQGSSSNVSMAPGYTLNSEIVAEGAATGTRFVTLASGGAGTVTMGVNGIVRLGASAGGDLTIRNSSAATLVNNGLISAESAGNVLSISNSTLTNSGTVSATGGTLTIGATNWTNAGTIGVGAGAVVNLGGTFGASGGRGTFANTGGVVNVTGTINNVGSTFALNSSTGSFTLLGGTITGGTITYAGGQSLLLSTSGGTLNGVTISGDLVLGASFTVLLSGATTFTAMRMQGSSSSVSLAPGYTLNSEILAEGAATGTRFVNLAVGGTGTVTMGANGIIRLGASSGGDMNVRNSSTATLVNNGLISAEASGMVLSITNSTLTNSGTVSATGGTLSISPTNWTNGGTIRVGTGAVVNLGGTLTAANGLGTFNNTGGTVNVVGTIVNASGFTLNTSTGSFTLLGGTINGGSISYANGQSLLLSTSGGTLNNVTVNGDLVLGTSAVVTVSGTTTFTTMRMQGSSSSLNLVPGYTLNSLVLAEGAATGTRFVNLAVGGTGTVTIAPGGTIRVGSDSGGDLSIRNSSAATLVNNGTISVEAAAATLTINNSVLTNNSTLQALAGTLSINPTNWTNAGTISVTTGAVVNMGGTLDASGGIGAFDNTGGTINITGSVNNTGSSIDLNVETGSLRLLGGTITGGSITYADGQSLLLTSSGGTLSGVAIAGDLVLGASVNVLLTGSTTFTAARLQGASSNLNMAPGFTLNSAVIAEGGAAGTRFVTLAVGGAGTVTVGSGGSIELAAATGGDLSVRNSSAATLVNNGTITAAAAGMTLTISNSTLSSAGTMQAAAGALTIGAANWTNTGTIGAATGGVVNLGGTFDATAGIGTFNNTGGTVNITGTLGNAGSTFTLDSSTGSFVLLGGTVSGGSIAYANGQSLLISSSGGTLDSVDIGGDIVLGTSASVLLTGTTTFSNARLTGNSSDLRMAPGFTLNSVVVGEGAATGTRFVTLAVGGAGTVTIGSSGVIRLGSSAAGPLQVRNSSTATLVNGGTISAEAAGATLSINNSTFTNNGTAQATAGTLAVTPTNWTNTGTLGVSTGAILSLEGTFDATAGIGTFANSGGTVNVVGSIVNTGSSFTLGTATGSFVLLGGSITGGSVVYANGQSLLLSTSGGTLTNVAIGGELLLGTNANVLLAGTTTFAAARLQGTNADLRMAPGYTLNSLVVAEGAGTGTRFVTMAVGGSGTVTIGSGGVVRLGAGAGGNLSMRNSSTATLVNGGVISAEATGRTLSIDNSTLTNNGTIQAQAGVLRISPTTWSNTGTLAVAAAATLQFEGTFNATAGFGTLTNTGGTLNLVGTLNNAGSTVTLNATTGSLTLLGGTISGGSLVLAGGQQLLLTTSGGTLENVSIGGDLLLGTSVSVVVSGTTSFGTARLQGNNSSLNMEGGYTLNNTVVAEGAAGGTRFVSMAVGGTGTVTIGSSGVIRLGSNSGGDLSIRNSSVASLVNNGLITAESTTENMSIGTTGLTNNGVLRSAGSFLTVSSLLLNHSNGVLTGGGYEVSAGGTIRLAGVSVQQLAASVSIDGATSQFTQGVSFSTGPALSQNLTILPAGSVSVSGGANLALTSLVNQGTVSVGSSSQLSTTGDLQTSGTVSLEVAGSAVGTFGRLVVGGAATVSGTLLAPFSGGFVPFASQPLTVISGSSLTGTFGTFTSGVSNGARLATSYGPTSLVLFGDTAIRPSTPVLAAASDTGASNSDRVTADNTPTLTGTAEPGSTVAILEGGVEVGSVVVGSDGIYTITTSSLGDGVRTLIARSTPTLGSPLDSAGSLSVTVDTAGPSITTPSLGTVTTTDPNGTSVNFVATATDAFDSAPLITYSIQPGSLFALGTTPVTATATDLAGNVSNAGFNVIVSRPVIDPTIGGLDSGFGGGVGVVTVTVPAARLRSLDSFVFGDGSVLTAGFDLSANQLVITRLGPDGSLDSGFGVGGSVRVSGPANLSARRVQFGVSGNIFVIGETPDDVPAVARYTQSGDRDGAFGTDGLLTVATFTAGTRIDAIAEGNTRIRGFLVAGSMSIAGVMNAVLVNVLPTLAVNAKFGTKGMFARPGGELGTFNAITITPKSLIFLGGVSSTGSSDDNSLQSSGVVVQLSSAGRVARFGTGTAATFGVPGFAITSGQEVVVQADGKVLLSAIVATSASDISAGRFGRAVVRFTAKGVLDSTFNGTGFIVVALPSTSAAPLSAVAPGSRYATFALRPIERAFDAAQSSLVLVPGGRLREIAAAVTGSSTNIVQSQVIADAVDLIAGTFTISARKPVKAGAKLSGSFRVVNSGTLAANGTVPIQLFFSADSVLDAGDTSVAPINNRISLKPGAARILKLPFAAPSTGGQFFVIAVINQSGVFTELKTTNGTAASATAFTVLAPPTGSAIRLLFPPRTSLFSELLVGDRLLA